MIYLGLWGGWLFICLTRWARRYHSKFYTFKGNPNSDEAFMGHLLMGLIPIIGIAYFTGGWLNNQDQKKATKQKELENVEKEVAQLLNESPSLEISKESPQRQVPQPPPPDYL